MINNTCIEITTKFCTILERINIYSEISEPNCSVNLIQVYSIVSFQEFKLI